MTRAADKELAVLGEPHGILQTAAVSLRTAEVDRGDGRAGQLANRCDDEDH